MEQDGQLSAYRERLLDLLRELPARRRREDPGSLQVFVNQECVGTLECDGGDSVISVNHPRPIRKIEIRTATGLLAGSLYALKVGTKTARFPVARHTIEVSVQNRLDHGSARVAYRAAVQWWDRAFKKMACALAPSFLLPSMRPKATVMAQIALAVVVLLLAADRLTGRFGTEGVVTQQERGLARLIQAQEAVMQTVRAQQEGTAAVYRAIDSLAQSQKRLSVNLVSVEQRMKALPDRTRREVKNSLLAELSNATAERERLRTEIQILTAAKESLTRDVALFEMRNRDLQQSVKQQASPSAKKVTPQEPGKSIAVKADEASSLPPSPTPQEAEAPPQDPTHPLTFWISFQDGTSEESIEQLVKEIHGHRGPTNAGWYNVEVNLPEPQTTEGFFELLRKAKIVKDLTTRLNTTPGQ